MNEDSRIAALVHRWRESYDRGIEPDLAELCKDSPELVEEVRRRILPATKLTSNADTGPPMSKSGEKRAEPTPGSSLGGFRLVRELGRGGMGVVFEAEDSTLGRRVALKMLHTDIAADDSYRQRFVREARAAAALRHDHVVTLHQVGQDGDTPFLVMEFLEGESLADRLGRQAPLPVPEAVRIAEEMAQGLAAAHAKGIVHRDVKPANVWLEAPKGRVKLLDFGLARPLDGPTLTAVGSVAGTVGYMAPEQIYAGQLDGRTDLYALGCVLYQMLWGEMPFQNTNTMALLQAVVRQDAPNLDAVAKTLPAPLGNLLRRLLARNPDDRPSTAAAVAAELADIQSHLIHPEKAPQPSTEYRRKAADHRHVGMWSGIIMVVLAVLVGAAVLIGRLSRPPSDSADTGTEPIAAAAPTGPPIKVGVLHSLTGMFRDSEKPMIEAIRLAADEINEAGGVLGRPIELVAVDPNSTESEYSRLAEQLITKDQVSVILGCWTSASRKGVSAVCQKHGNLLVHSVLNEGLEEHPNVVYVGGGPNLQLHEAVNFMRTAMGKKKFFLVGSGYDLYSHIAHAILSDDIKELGGTVVGDEYLPMGGGDPRKVVDLIKSTGADVIFNTVDAASNSTFTGMLRPAGIDPKNVPTVWLGIGEEEMGALDRRQMIGDFSVMPYFYSLDLSANKKFLKHLKAKYPTRQRVSDTAEASYCAMFLWKQAVEKARTPDPLKVYDAFRGQTFDGPEGVIKIDPTNLYAWRWSRVGKLEMVEDTPTFVVVKEIAPLRPEPFPKSRTRAEWEALIDKLHKEWGGWTRRGPAP